MNPIGSNVKTIGVVLRGDARQYSAAMAQGAAATKAFETQTTTSAARWSVAWKIAAVGVLAIIGLVAIGLGGAAKQAADFEQKMRNVNSLVQQSETVFRGLNVAVLNLAKTVPQSAGNLAEGLYDVTSSGFYAADSILVLTAAAKAASAGMSTTSDAVKGVTAVLNAYGLSAASSNDVSDALFMTVNLGVVRFEELTSVIGNVVGTAAAAKVPIQDVGAAIATMTLNGISAAESGTALNRLLQSMLQPSDALAAVYKKLGYESGSSALEQDGLYVVMEKIREATGGNVDEILKLFPEMRALKGAFALTSGEGATYTRVMGEMGVASKRLGATQAAFDEQMKATKNQWAVLTSGLQSNSVVVGQTVLPAFIAMIQAGQTINDQFLPTMKAAADTLYPFFHSLYEIGVDVAQVLGTVADAALPLVAAFGAIAGSVVLYTLEAVANVLEAMTGFLADNKGAAVLLASFLLARFVPSITAVAAQVGLLSTRFGLAKIAAADYARTLLGTTAANQRGVATDTARTAALGRTAVAFRVASGAAKAFAASAVVATLGTAALLMLVLSVVNSMTTAADGVKESVAQINAGIDQFDFASLDEGVAAIAELRTNMDDFGARMPAWQMALSPGGLYSGLKEFQFNKKFVEVEEAAAALDAQIINTKVNMSGLATETGLTFDEVAKLASEQKIDLTPAYGTEEAAAGRNQLIQYLGDIEKRTGVSTKTMAADWQFDIDQMLAFTAAVDKAGEAAGKAFANDTNILGTFKVNTGVQEEADALEALNKARADYAKTQKDSADNADALARSQESVTQAEEKYTEAVKYRTDNTLTNTYRRAIEMSSDFSKNIQSAVQAGLDPAYVARLLEEGPTQAGPIVQQLVDDNSGALIQMVNDSEARLAEINTQIVIQARLTAKAINSESDQMARDLGKAFTISDLALQGKTAEEIAKEMGISVQEVERIASADQFGINLAKKISAAYENWWAANPLKPPNFVEIGGATSGRPVNAGMYANGGIYPGYTPGRDIGFIGVSGGEAIMRPEFARAVGPAQIEYWNRLARTGGVNAIRQSLAPYLGGFAGGGTVGSPQVITVPVTQRNETLAPIHIEKMYARDVSDFERQARLRRRRDNLGGL